MGENSDTPHERLDGVCIHDSFTNTWDEEGSLPAFKLVIQVDQECEK